MYSYYYYFLLDLMIKLIIFQWHMILVYIKLFIFIGTTEEDRREAMKKLKPKKKKRIVTLDIMTRQFKELEITDSEDELDEREEEIGYKINAEMDSRANKSNNSIYSILSQKFQDLNDNKTYNRKKAPNKNKSDEIMNEVKKMYKFHSRIQHDEY